MFFSADWLQEVIALGLATLAALYVIKTLTGWPKWRKRPPDKGPDPIHMGDRLAQGLKKVHQNESLPDGPADERKPS